MLSVITTCTIYFSVGKRQSDFGNVKEVLCVSEVIDATVSEEIINTCISNNCFGITVIYTKSYRDYQTCISHGNEGINSDPKTRSF